MIEVRAYKPADVFTVLNEITEEEKFWAEINSKSGPALTGVYKGEVVGCGGIRIWGVGEVWACFSPKMKNFKKSAFRLIKENMDRMILENNLWRIKALAKEGFLEADRFLKHLGFEREDYFSYAKVK